MPCFRSRFAGLLWTGLLFISGISPCRADEGALGGVAITPDFAQSLYERLLPLAEADGCRLIRFDTKHSFIDIGLQAPSGSRHSLQIAAAGGDAADVRQVAGWVVSISAGLEAECPQTRKAIEAILVETPRDAPWRADRWTSVRANYYLLAVSFVLLLAWTLRLLHREAKLREPSRPAVWSLISIWAAALAVRLVLSPRTFLHENYHIAEALPAFLKGETGPVYGDTGPALFQLAAFLLRRPDDPNVIFLTTAFLASLAIPAVALLDLVLNRSWPRAICAAVLLCVLPHHLRFSASDVLFVQSVTFGIWSLALFGLYMRTHRLEDGLCAALALSLAIQTRPEMHLFPVALPILLLLTQPRSWRLLFARRTLLALLFLGVLLIPRFFELRQVLSAAAAPPPKPPDLQRYLSGLVVFRSDVMPWVYRPLLVAGTLCGLWRVPGLIVWTVLVILGSAFVSLSLFDNAPYNLRSQLLPASLTVLLAAGSASLWMALWRGKRRVAATVGACALAVFAVVVVAESRGFVTQLQDQQLEWTFLEHTVPKLPAQATLLAVADVGGRSLAAFPKFLLQREEKSFRLLDVRRAAEGKIEWPAPGGAELLFYQGMYCYFAFPEEPSPDPMTPACRAVHERYELEPLFVTDLDTTGYSPLVYAPGPYRIGFFRLRLRD